MKKMITKVLMVAVVVVGSFGAGEAMANDTMRAACKQAFDGKCYHGDAPEIFPGQIGTEDDAQAFCASKPSYCPNECVARLSVISNIRPLSTKGNPCL